MVGDAVTDVWFERGEDVVDDGPRPKRTDDDEWRWFEGHDPPGGDHVVQGGDVIAV